MFYKGTQSCNNIYELFTYKFDLKSNLIIIILVYKPTFRNLNILSHLMS